MKLTNKVLYRPAKAFEDFAHPARNNFLANQMISFMRKNNGIGLAATQVGDLRRVLVMDVEQTHAEDGSIIRGKPMYLVNPEILGVSDEMNVYQEGCLSFPEQFAEVERPKMVTISYLDYHGNLQKITADELLATCVQHEIDHLDGKVFVDHISKLKRDMIIRRLVKMQRFAE
jgi:peptide deformylase